MSPLNFAVYAGAAALLTLLILPLVVLLGSVSEAGFYGALESSLFAPAFELSLKTSLMSIVCIAAGGTPLAWWIAKNKTRFSSALSWVLNIPIVVPPAVIGIALLITFGREGFVGALLESWGISIAFGTGAVVLAQCVVAAPFYIQGATSTFRNLDDEMLFVARSLGASKRNVFLRIVLPIALPGLLSALSIAWARALGEFGATLLFAGSLRGRTQTLPLAIYAALESNIETAIALSLALVGLATILVLGLHAIALTGTRLRARV